MKAIEKMSGQKTSEPLLEAIDLAFSYREEKVLRAVNFAVYSGDFVEVVGGNGAGKSTLLRLLLREILPDSGEIRLFGQSAERFRDWSRIGYVPQNGVALAEGFPATVREVVSMGLYSKAGLFRPLRASHRQRVGEALAQVEMGEYAEKRIHQLSGGQIQRVLVARALAGDSRLLLLDEPTTGVDGDSTLALYELLASLTKGGVAVVMVTHDMERAHRYTNRTFCLERGTLLELTGEQILHEMAHRHHHPS